ncbi:MAG: hypothetical protein IKX24_11595 [Prevotella sp.]|nr:hypothetical protein [Prevotella sp.]
MRILYLFIVALFSMTIKAQFQADHALEVKRLTNWAPDYLTVTNNWNNMCIEPEAPTLKYLSVITAINGESTKDMDEAEFYNILDNNNSFELSYQTKTNGQNKQFTKHFTKRKGKLLVTKAPPTEMPATISLLSDMDVDFFAINTFDYRLAGDDQLMDKTLMEVFADRLQSKGLKRTTDNPDIYLYITKDVNQKIESMYVPQYKTTTESDGTSVGMGNFLGVRGLSVGGSSGNATTVTQDVGYMRTNVQADAYLEFSILDSRKLNNENAPVIWQLTYSEHCTNEIRLLEMVKRWIGSWALEYPFHESVMSSSVSTWGVFCNNFMQDTTISDIVSGSKAEQMGCKVGDAIKYIKYADNTENSCYFRPGQSFYASQIIPTTVMMQIGKQKYTKGGVTENVSYNYIY